MNEESARGYEGWAIVEIFGHQKYAGQISTETIGAACMLRLDVPELPAREEIVPPRRYIYDEKGDRIPPGATIQRSAIQGFTKFFGVAAIYAITPATQEAALAALEAMQERPVQLVKLPEQLTAIAAAADASPDERRGG